MKLGLTIQRTSSALAFAAVAFSLVSGSAEAVVEKPFRKPLIKDISKDAKVDVDASQIIYDPKTDIATATGKVVLIYGPYKLTATKVVFNRKTNVLTANGSVELKEPNGNVARATTLSIDTAFRDGFARHLTALLTNDVTITAVYAKRKQGRVTIFEHATYTACKNCETRSGKPLWQLVTDRTVHDQVEHTLTHTNPRLQISGVTVAAFPYLKLPDPSVKRRTGFLIPSIRNTDYTGYGVIIPYYWAPAPNYDLTLKPWLTTNQGPIADVEWRHRLKTGSYSVNAYGVYQWDKQNLKGDDKRFRGALETKGRFALNEDWDYGWNGTAITDKTFLRRYGFDNKNISQNDIFLTGLWDQSYITTGVMNFEALTASIDNDELPSALPYLNVEHTFADPVFGGSLGFNLDSYSLWRNDATTPFDTVNHGTMQSRIVSELAWQKEMTLGGGQLLTTFAKLRSDVYVTDKVPDAATGNAQDQEVTHRFLPSTGVDVRWPFIASNDWGNHILTPVMQVIAAPDETNADDIGNEDAITLNFDHTSLFLDNRFTGLDRYEGGVRSNIGLTYNLLRDDGSFIRASIGESFHIAGKNSFTDRSGLDGSSSDIVAGLTVSPWEGVSLSYEGRVEEDFSAINRQEASLGLSFDRFSGNAGYLFIDKEPAFGRTITEEFLQGNTRIGLSDGWYLNANMTYDLQTNFFRNRGIGIEFDCDCMNAKLAYSEGKSREDSVTDRRVTFSINLATLGKTSVDSRF